MVAQMAQTAQTAQKPLNAGLGIQTGGCVLFVICPSMLDRPLCDCVCVCVLNEPED